MTSLSSKPVAHLSSPGDIVATIPSLCGFTPRDSIVVLSLRGPRKRLGLTIRLDLPEPRAVEAAGELLAERVAHDGGAAAVIAVFGRGRDARLVRRVSAALEERGVEVTEALHVEDGRWSSYVCARSCCPAEGTPVPPVPELVDAEQALHGRAVLSSREELVRSLAAPVLRQAEAAAQALEPAMTDWVERLGEDREGARAQLLHEARSALDLVAEGGAIDVRAAARLAVALHDVQVRDEIATWSLKRSDALLALVEQVVRHTVPPFDAPACALLAWVSYARGDGSRANVALDRALDTDPAYSLALLLRQALDAAVAPREVRRILRSTKRALRAS